MVSGCCAAQDKGDLRAADAQFRAALEAGHAGSRQEALALGANHGVLLTRMGRPAAAAVLLRQTLAEAEVLVRAPQCTFSRPPARTWLHRVASPCTAQAMPLRSLSLALVALAWACGTDSTR